MRSRRLAARRSFCSITRWRTVSEFARAASMRLRRSSRISDCSQRTRFDAAAGLGHLDSQRPLVRIGIARRRGLTAHEAIDLGAINERINFGGRRSLVSKVVI